LGAGEKLAVVLTAVGVSGRDQHVLRQRLRGRSFEQIAWDRECRVERGGVLSRQRMQQIERAALARVGLSGSVESVILTAERAGGSDLAHDRAGGTFGLSVGRGAWVKLTRADREHERAVAKFLRSKGVTA
jgi:hypothetical protein